MPLVPRSAVPRIAAWVTALNFVAYVITACILGGDAWNGRIQQGHYYLSMHGHLTEVSRAMFEYSLWHTYVLWINFAVIIALRLLGWLPAR